MNKTMKKITLFMLLIMLPSGIFTAQANGERENERIAFLGIGSGNLRSNYYPDEIIAGKMNVPEDSINETFGRRFYEILNETCVRNGTPNIVYCCFEEGRAILASVKYNSRGDEMESDLSAVSQERLDDFFEQTSTGYLMIIDQYYIKREGYPYHNVSHIVAYSVYDSKREIVFRGRHQFSSLDMEEFSRYTRQFSKIAQKLLAKIH
ncbi:MAG: hypothetical protein LBJ47_04690 [Tannerella sp.]|jgi:hypothetical protein|nr:hypothetical protein [Tannerella sp.]